jgi:hypothetical protein
MIVLRPVFTCLPLLAALFLGACAHSVGRDEHSPADTPPKSPLAYGPDFYKRGPLNPASLAAAANHFTRMGETRAIAALLAETPSDQAEGRRIDYRRYWIIQLLFESSDPHFLGPYLGLPMLLSGPTAPAEKRARHRTWPQLPLVESRGIYFLIEDGYITSGRVEPLAETLERCRRQARFRTRELKVPHRAEAQAAFDVLVKRPEWRELTGEFRDFFERGLRRQIAATPE